jgi:hypothetical protein
MPALFVWAENKRLKVLLVDLYERKITKNKRLKAKQTG